MSDQVVTPRRDGLTWRRVEDEIVVLDVESSRYFSFNSTGARLWERLTGDGPAAESALSQQLVQEFEISRDLAESDVAEFVEHCRECGLLQ